jgi:TolB-like protein/tetratricopeptide (TPR) repeat protein/predicted Ser/Thr protein kinase
MQGAARLPTETNKIQRVCAKCGATVFADSPRGFCSVCLFKTGLGPLDEGCADEHEPIRIDLEFGDYELLEEIGRGGQGVVYRARQKSLNRTVALKVIGLGRWSSSPHLKRFRHEAEAAASLEHPQIVPIYEIGERDGSCYFSMKFVEGGRLDEIIKRESMSPRRAAELLLKIARTVQFAHEHGILHRDIKPGNILLDQSGEPHLTDFGLARLIEQESTITNSFEVLGTPSYMPPEQATGHAKELTPAADVYSLGAVLYHMLTAEPPFAGGTTYETIRMVLESDARNPRDRNQRVDVDLATICLKCLRKNPADRYATAKALVEDLERWLRHEPIQARRTGVFSRAAKWVRRNPTITTLAAVIIALAAVVATMWWRTINERLPESGIAVLPFDNLSDDKRDAYFVDGMQDDVLTKLAKISGLKVISRTSVMQYRGERNVRKIANGLRVSHVLEGSVRKTGDKIHLNAQLIDARTDNHVWAETYDRDRSDLFAVETAVAQQVANRLVPGVSTVEKRALETIPTRDLQAYELYTRGRQLMSGASITEPDVLEKFAEAANLFQRAVERDGSFALAYCALAEANLRLYWVQPPHPPDRRDKAEAALKEAMRLAPDAGETHLIHGLFLYWADRDYERALEELETAAQLLPNSAETYEISSWIERRVGRWRAAIRHCLKAVELNPAAASSREDLGHDYLFVRRYADAIRVADGAIAAFPSHADAFRILKAQILLEMGDLDNARRTIDSFSPDVRITADKFLVHFSLLLYEHNYAEAERYIARWADLADRGLLVLPDTFFAGIVARAQNENERSAAAFLECRKDLEKQIQERPSVAMLIFTLGLVDAGLGRKDEALAELRHAIEISENSERYDFALDLPNAYCWLGDRERALNELQKLLNEGAIGVNYGDLKFNPAWDSLRDDPRFEKILAEAAKPLSLK